MPSRICSKPGCGTVLKRGEKCPKHDNAPKRAYHTDKRRGRATAHQRGYGSQWRRARLVHLANEPLCRHCKARGVITEATEVDHIIRHQGRYDPKFWDTDNWQSLCKPCHSTKTRREESDYK